MKRSWAAALYAVAVVTVAGLGAYASLALFMDRTPEVKVPDVGGLGLAEALDAITVRGLDLEVRDFLFSEEVPENRILRQRPAPGEAVRVGRSVGVVLSRGPERHPVPDLRGLPLEEARILLEEAGLATEVSARIPGGPEGVVLGQGTAPGTWLPKDRTVPLLVSTGPRPVILRMPRLDGASLETALAQLEALGLRAARVEEVSLEDPTRVGRVISQDPPGGHPVPQGEGVVLSVAGAPRSAPPAQEVWVTRSFPPGFAKHRVEVLVERGAATRAAADEWVEGGETFRLLVTLQPGERLRLRVNGKEQPLAPDHAL